LSKQLLFVTSNAIQTKYHGFLFRSRLEARWAVFYDSLGIEWEYEKEGYDLGDAGLYLPDFWLPRQKCWVEIKGEEPSDKESLKARCLSICTSYPVFIFFGKIEPYHGQSSSSFLYHPDDIWDNCYRWCECRQCGKFGIEFEGRTDRLPCRGNICEYESGNRDRAHNDDSDKLLRAYSEAKSARFEFGGR